MEKEICSKCNQPKEMYYELFCPRCDKPEMQTKNYYNLFRCMYHIEAIGNPGYKKRLWSFILDDIQGNDSYITLSNEDAAHASDDIKLLFDTFNIKEKTMTFFVSW